jgi:hypothetical protein
MGGIRPWWRVAFAIAIGIAAATLIVAAFRFGQITAAFNWLKAVFVSQGLNDGDAGNLAAGTLQSVVEVVILVGLFTVLFGFVNRGFRTYAVRGQAVTTALRLYETFVVALLAVRQVERGKGRAKFNSFLSKRILRLKRATEELSELPTHLDSSLLQTRAFADDLRQCLEPFYDFVEGLTEWRTHRLAELRRDFSIGSRSQGETGTALLKLDSLMMDFFRRNHLQGKAPVRLKEELSTQMAELAKIANRFITAERTKEPVPAAPEPARAS